MVDAATIIAAPLALAAALVAARAITIQRRSVNPHLRTFMALTRNEAVEVPIIVVRNAGGVAQAAECDFRCVARRGGPSEDVRFTAEPVDLPSGDTLFRLPAAVAGDSLEEFTVAFSRLEVTCNYCDATDRPRRADMAIDLLLDVDETVPFVG